MQLDRLICIDALEGFKLLPDNFIDLIITSPPFSNIRKSYPGPDPEQYTEWFTPILKEIKRTLTPNGSFILNINDKVKNKERIPYPFEIVIKARELELFFIDTIIWRKTNGAPTAGKRRADYFEYIFHFAKSLDYTWLPDPIRTSYPESSIKRARRPIKQNVSNREGRGESKQYKKWVLNEYGAFPKNVIDFPKDQGKSHVASYHPELPKHFILSHSNEGDLVLDPFAGKGTTLFACRELKNRRFLGFEIKQEYCNLARELYGIETK